MLPSISYEPIIEIKFEGEVIHTSPFIQTFYILRMPFVKMASFSILTVPLPREVIFKLEYILKQSKFPEVNLKIHSTDTRERGDGYGYKIKDLVFNNIYNILHLVKRQKLTDQIPVIPVTLFLAQIQFHNMALGNSYNKILRNVTGLNALEDYENYLINRYGTSFKFKRAGVDDALVTQEVFEQIFIKGASDLIIPQIILNTHKPLKALSYYFFDEFMITSGMNTGILVSLQNPELFERFDTIANGYDLLQTLKFNRVITISDRLNILRQNMSDASVVMRNRHGITNIHKSDNAKVSVPRIEQSDSLFDFLPNNPRQIQRLDETLTSVYEEKESNQHISIYAPDTFETATERYENIKTFLDNNTEYLYEYEAHRVHIDAVQLNRSYNLNLEDPTVHYIPISIMNIFYRINPHESTLTHACRFQTIRYANN